MVRYRARRVKSSTPFRGMLLYTIRRMPRPAIGSYTGIDVRTGEKVVGMISVDNLISGRPLSPDDAGPLLALAEGDQLTLSYQPQVVTAAGRLRGVEALLRWHHPVHGWIPPDHFIGPADQTSVIVPLTRWVLQTALRQARGWMEKGCPCAVAVNLSALSLRDANCRPRSRACSRVTASSLRTWRWR